MYWVGVDRDNHFNYKLFFLAGKIKTKDMNAVWINECNSVILIYLVSTLLRYIILTPNLIKKMGDAFLIYFLGGGLIYNSSLLMHSTW